MEHIVLKLLRRIYGMTHTTYFESDKIIVDDLQGVASLIKDTLLSDKPCMIARFGAFELATINNYLSIVSDRHSIIDYIKGKQEQWWWNKQLLNHLSINAGFFPIDKDSVVKFCNLLIEDAKEVDIIASWLNGEKKILSQSVKYIPLALLNPIKNPNPWSYYLKDKKILIIHPFAETIEKQYKRRKYLFYNPNILPEFTLITYKAVQSIGGHSLQYNSWFDALEQMKKDIEEIDFDIALIACGAYGFPLAAHIKRLGKKAVHMGGPLQLLFGIKGKRWDQMYADYYNEYWVRPSSNEIPQAAQKIENGCYW